MQLLVNAFDVANIEVIVFFDGTLPTTTTYKYFRQAGATATCSPSSTTTSTTSSNGTATILPHIVQHAKDTRQKTIAVLKHIRMIGTPPPKIWWLPPSGIRTCIRNALRSLNVRVVQTVHDHQRELIDYYREHRLHGIIGQHVDYVVAQPQHYYSSHDLRLSYKGTLETKEYLVDVLLARFGVTGGQLPLVAALFGGIADREVLRGVQQSLGVEQHADAETRMRTIVQAVADAMKAAATAAATTGNEKTVDVKVFVEHLKLDGGEAQGEGAAAAVTAVRTAIEYYQRRVKLVKVGGGGAKQQKEQQKQQKSGGKSKKGKAKNGECGCVAFIVSTEQFYQSVDNLSMIILTKL